MKNNKQPSVYDIPVAAQVLNVSKSFLYKEVAAGTIPSIRLGKRRVLIPASVIENLLNGWKKEA